MATLNDCILNHLFDGGHVVTLAQLHALLQAGPPHPETTWTREELRAAVRALKRKGAVIDEENDEGLVYWRAVRRDADAVSGCCKLAKKLGGTKCPICHKDVAQRWTLETGRTLCLDGKPQFELRRAEVPDPQSGHGTYNLAPSNADALAQAIVALLNANESAQADAPKSLYGGWPMLPAKSARTYGADVLTCPKCGSQDIILTGAYAARGTGPGGRGRLGDPGGRSWAECKQCGARGYHEKES